MIKDNPISLGYWGDPSLSKKLGGKGRSLKHIVTLEKKLKSVVSELEETTASKEDTTEYAHLLENVLKSVISREGIYSNELILPDVITSINSMIFYNNNSLEEIDTNKVTVIQDGAFIGCNNLTKLTLGENITTLGNYIIAAPVAVKWLDVYIKNETPCTLGTDVFGATEDNGSPITLQLRIHVPAGTESAYQSAWSQYANYIVVPT